MTYSEFEKIWDESLHQEMLGLESLRKEERVAIIFSIISAIVAVILFIWTGPFSLLFGALGGIFAYISVRPKEYRAKFKEKAVCALVRRTKFEWMQVIKKNQTGGFFKSFYSKFAGEEVDIARNNFTSSGLYYSPITSFETDDIFTSNKYPVRMEELDISHGSGKHKHIVFKGLLFTYDLRRPFTGETYIRSDKDGTFGTPVGTSASRKIFSSNIRRTELEWNDFEELLSVDTTNEVEAREILDPYFMENLYAWWKNHKKVIRVSFKGTHMYMSIRYWKNMFEPNPFSSMESQKKKLWEYLDAFLLFEGLAGHMETKFKAHANHAHAR